MSRADFEHLLNRIHVALVRAAWRDEWEPVLRDPAVLAREAGLDGSNLDTWSVAKTYWTNLVAAYATETEKIEEETIE